MLRKIIWLYIKAKFKHKFKPIDITGITQEKIPPIIIMWYDVKGDPSGKTIRLSYKRRSK